MLGSSRTTSSQNCAALTLHAELRNELERLMAIVQDLKITCANDSTLINHLKQNNLRLSGIVSDLQQTPHALDSMTGKHSITSNKSNYNKLNNRINQNFISNNKISNINVSIENSNNHSG